MKKLIELADASFYAAVAHAIGGDVETYMSSKTPEYAYYTMLTYKDVMCYDNLEDTVPGSTVTNASYFCTVYGEAIQKAFDSLTLTYDTLSLINLTKDIAFDATDSKDRTMSSESDTETTSATTFDSSTQVPTGEISANYTRADNLDITLDHDTTETTTGTDGKRTPQELIRNELDFRAQNVFMAYVCSLVKKCFDCGVYE